jgi:hypothetical protein
VTDLYTNSRLRVFNECQRKHHYKYDLGIQTPQTSAMRFGSLAHEALEAWYRAWQADGDRLLAALAIIDTAEEIDDVDRIRLRVLAAAYDARWGAEDWEIIGVEVEFRYWLGERQLGGKIDAIIRHADGRNYIVEHKTSTADTSPGSLYWDRLALDSQVSIYLDGAEYGLEIEIAGCIYDVLQRPQHELKLATPSESRRYTVGKGCSKCGGSAKAGHVAQGRGYYEVRFGADVTRNPCDGCAGTGWKVDGEGKPQAPRLDARQRDTDESLDEFTERLTNEVAERVDEFLSRSVIVRLDHELPRMRQDLLDTIAVVEHTRALNLYPPNHGACVRGRDACPFFAACAGRADLSDETMFPRGATHPELASAA